MNNETVVVGWFVLAFLQAVVLVKQNNLNEKLEGFRLRASRKVLQLEGILEWAQQGYKTMMEFTGENFIDIKGKDFESRITELRNDLRVWSIKAFYFNIMANEIWDKRYKKDLSTSLVELQTDVQAVFSLKPEEFIELLDARDPNAPFLLATQKHAKLIEIVEDYIEQATNEK